MRVMSADPCGRFARARFSSSRRRRWPRRPSGRKCKRRPWAASRMRRIRAPFFAGALGGRISFLELDVEVGRFHDVLPRKASSTHFISSSSRTIFPFRQSPECRQPTLS